MKFAAVVIAVWGGWLIAYALLVGPLVTWAQSFPAGEYLGGALFLALFAFPFVTMAHLDDR